MAILSRRPNRDELRQLLLARLSEGWHFEPKPNGRGVCWHYDRGSLKVPAWLLKEMIAKGYCLNLNTGLYEPPKAE